MQTTPAVEAAASLPLAALGDVPVRVQAVLGRCRMTLAELAALTPGKVLELDRRVGEPVDILINDRLVARGEVVLMDEQLGVTLNELLNGDSAAPDRAG